MKFMGTFCITFLSLTLLVWAAACAGPNNMMDDEMGAKMDGMFMGSEGHHAAGKATIGMGMMNRSVLTLSNIKVDKVPDGYVYLTKNADHMHGVELGKLNQFTGTVSFDIPAGVNSDDFDSVVIWCKKFNVEIGRAYL